MIFRIAIIDDSGGDIIEAFRQDLREWLSEILHDRNIEALVDARAYKVTRGAPTWEEALKSILSESPDIVFVDEQMPDRGDGEVFIGQLREGGYLGYTYLHTAVTSVTQVKSTIDDYPRLLKGHGTGAVRKGEKKDVVEYLSKHLEEGKNKLPLFRVADPRVFIGQAIGAIRESGESASHSGPADDEGGTGIVAVSFTIEPLLKSLKEHYEPLYSPLVDSIKALRNRDAEVLNGFLNGSGWKTYRELAEQLKRKVREERIVIDDLDETFIQTGNISSFQDWWKRAPVKDASKIDEAVNYYAGCALTILDRLRKLTGD